MIFKLGELFCGPGGIALGAMNAKVRSKNEDFKIEHMWANDYDFDTCKTYIRNICPDKPNSVYCCDVKNLNISSLEPIDAFAYGFPCNDFSVVGEHKGFDGSFGPLYSYGVKVINTFKPKFFIAENVGGLTSANEGKAFNTIINDLKNAGNGYNLTVHLYKSEYYGVPQTRHRVVIVGIDKQFGFVYKVPKPTTIESPVTVRTALSGIPKNSYNNEITKQSGLVVERLKHINPGENVWTANLPDELKLNVKSAKLSQIYKRLHPDKPSYTITGSGGGGTHGYHWDEPRALTNRERARIQSFPDDFVFEGSKESVRKQIGMAVPPVLANHVFNAILKTFANIEYEHIGSSFVIDNYLSYIDCNEIPVMEVMNNI
jgi:DNA (cytosine-5)-methyltransferase 1